MKPADKTVAHAIDCAASEFPWSKKQFADSLLADDYACLLELDSTVVGFAIFKQVLDESTLLNIAIDPDYQGKGYGRWLLEQGLKQQMARGMQSCFLEVRKSNHQARALYCSLGFIQVGVRKDYYPTSQGREHALLMSREFPRSFIGEV